MQRENSSPWRLRLGRPGWWWLTSALAIAFAAVIACGGAGQPGADLARELGGQLSDELRAYRDSGAEASLESARATCVEIQAEATTGRLSGTDYGYGLNSACELVNVVGQDPRASVESAITLVDLALQKLD